MQYRPGLQAPGRRPQWLAAVIGFVVGIVASALVMTLTGAEDSASVALGRVIAPVVLTSAAMLFVLRRSPAWFRVLWVVAFAGLIVGVTGLGVTVRTYVQQQQAFYRELDESIAESQRAFREVDRNVDTPAPAPRPPASDEGYARANYVYRRVMWERLESARRYQRDLRASGWSQLLEPTELRAADARGRVQQRAGNARKAVDDWVRREHAIIRRFARDMAKERLPFGIREGFTRAIASGDAERRYAAIAASEKSIIDAEVRVADILLSNRWQWDARQQAFLFYTDAGLADFQRAQSDLDARIREGEARRNEMEQQVSRLRELIGKR